MKLLAKDIMNKDFRKVEPDLQLSKALDMLDGTDDALIVGKKDYLGIVTETMIFKKRSKQVAPQDTKLGSFAVKDVHSAAPKIEMDMNLAVIARLMVETGMMILPVMEKGDIKGIVDSGSILDNLPPTIKNSPIREFMTKDVRTIRSDDKISSFSAILKEHDITGMPVIEDGQMVGIATIHDFAGKLIRPEQSQNYTNLMSEKNRLSYLPVKDIMVNPVVTAGPDEQVGLVSKMMGEKDLNSVVIVDKAGDIKGIVTRKDLLRPMAEAADGILSPNINVSAQINGVDLRMIGDIITSHSEKHAHLLKRSMYDADVRSLKETHRGKQKLSLSLRVISPAGRYFASAQGWEESVITRHALEKIDRQIDKRLGLSDKEKKKEFGEVPVVASEEKISGLNNKGRS